jgi:hypothetical protein
MPSSTSRFILFLLCFANPVQAQIYVQKYQVEKVSFQYRSNNLEESRCLKWFPLRGAQKFPVQYTKTGEPYLSVTLRARVVGECPLQFENTGRIAEVPTDKPEQKRFEIKVTPPVSVITVEGPDFIDELVVEAPLKEFEDIGFFTYFSRSQVDFDLKFASLATNNPSDTILTKQVNLFPILSGFLTIPLPLVRSLYAGMGMSQNLGNFMPKGPVPTQFSEVVFDLRFAWSGRETSGRPSLALATQYIARNIYQTNASDDEKTFLLTSATLFGGGIEGSYYFWNQDWGPRLGIFGDVFYYLGGAGGTVRSISYEGGMNYRINKKWAIGLGYQGKSFSLPNTELDDGSRVTESQMAYFLRLSLVPFLGGPKGK